MAFAQVSCRSTRRGVREHPAPSGALRPAVARVLDTADEIVREHPAPSGALRPALRALGVPRARQGAPSTIRCIKTRPPTSRGCPGSSAVREHPAPSGALRQVVVDSLRLFALTRQGAPSTTRCIKTRRSSFVDSEWMSVREHPAPPGALRPAHSRSSQPNNAHVREHPAPSGALRLLAHEPRVEQRVGSGSTQHHQVH